MLNYIDNLIAPLNAYLSKSIFGAHTLDLIILVILAVALILISPKKRNYYLYLIGALANIIFGVNLLTEIDFQSPDVLVVLIIAIVLIALGLWGFAIWIKSLTAKAEGDEASYTEKMYEWWSTIRAFDLILILSLVFRILVAQPFIVEGQSMDSNFHDRQTIIVDNISYLLRQPERGEVVIFVAPPNPQDDYIKRVIALPGETITIDQSKVYINGKLLNEPYLTSATQIPKTDQYLQKKLGANEYFVMGDNRPFSSDSRDWGILPRTNIIGRAIVTILPLNNFHLIKNPI